MAMQSLEELSAGSNRGFQRTNDPWRTEDLLRLVWALPVAFGAAVALGTLLGVTIAAESYKSVQPLFRQTAMNLPLYASYLPAVFY